MPEYTPPEITSLTPTADQQEIIDLALQVLNFAPVFHTGRGAGKSTLRAMIAQAFLEEDFPLYEVKPRVIEYD